VWKIIVAVLTLHGIYMIDHMLHWYVMAFQQTFSRIESNTCSQSESSKLGSKVEVSCLMEFHWLVTLHVFPPKYVLLNTWCKQHHSAIIKLSHRCQKPKQVCQLNIQIGTTMLWWYQCEIQKLKEGGISCWRPEGSSAWGHQERRW